MEGETVRAGPPRFEKLDEDYRTWSTYARAYLKNRGVWSAVVDARPGSVLPLAGETVIGPGLEGNAGGATPVAEAARLAFDKAKAAWDRKNEVALSDIQMAVKPHLLSLVEDCALASEEWESLKTLFEDDATSRRAELEQELAVLQMAGGETMIKYVGRAKGLRNALATAGVTVDEHSLVLHVLRGLPPTVCYDQDRAPKPAIPFKAAYHYGKAAKCGEGGTSGQHRVVPLGEGFHNGRLLPI